MKKLQLVIQHISTREILRIGFLLFMSVHLSFGYLSQHLDCFEANEIELTKDKESEEKEGKEEIEKDKLLTKLSLYAPLNEEKLHLQYNIYGNWEHTQGEVPTPPPKATSI